MGNVKAVQIERLTMTIPEAAQVLGISKSRMYTLARSEGFPLISVGRRQLISRKGLERWVEKQTEKAMAGLM